MTLSWRVRGRLDGSDGWNGGGNAHSAEARHGGSRLAPPQLRSDGAKTSASISGPLPSDWRANTRRFGGNGHVDVLRGIRWLADGPVIRHFFAAALVVTSATASERVTVQGEAVAVDGDTLIVDGYRVRIHGLHASGLGEPGGLESKRMAQLVVTGEYVICTIVDTDRHGSFVADCVMESDGADFAEVMIRAGHADHCARDGRPDLSEIPRNGFELPSYCSLH